MFRRIMVPLDGSPFGDYVLPTAATLARHTGATLDLVHVHQFHETRGNEEGLTPYRYEHVAELERAIDGLEWQAEAERLDGIATALRRRESVPVSIQVLHGGNVARALLDHAREAAIDFVVMATHGPRSDSPFTVGSVASRLVHELEMPLLLLRPDSDLPVAPPSPSFQHVLVPLDGSPRSEEVLPAARALAYPFASSVTLLRVIEHGIWPVNALEVQLGDGHRKDAARAYLGDVAERITATWVPPTVAVTTHESVARGILESADTVGADLIAMATHGRTGVSRLVLGSVASEVLRATRIPLLLFGPAAVARAHADIEATGRAIDAFSI